MIGQNEAGTFYLSELTFPILLVTEIQTVYPVDYLQVRENSLGIVNLVQSIDPLHVALLK